MPINGGITDWIINGRIKTRAFLTPLLGSYISLYWNIHSLCFALAFLLLFSLFLQLPSPAQAQSAAQPDCLLYEQAGAHLHTNTHTCTEEHPGQDGFKWSVIWYHPVSVSSSQSRPFPLCLIKWVFLCPLSQLFFFNLLCLFLPLFALQTYSPVFLVFPLSQSCLLTDRWAYLITCLVLFHQLYPVSSLGLCLNLEALHRDWVLYGCLWQYHISHQVLWSQQEHCWNKYGSQVPMMVPVQGP